MKYMSGLSLIAPCRQCQSSDIFIDHAAGDMICKKCGLVLGASMIDDRPEWQNFEDSPRSPPGDLSISFQSQSGEDTSKLLKCHLKATFSNIDMKFMGHSGEVKLLCFRLNASSHVQVLFPFFVLYF